MSNSQLAALVGTISGVITVLSFLPQATRALRTRRTQDLSRGTFVMLVLQSAGWTSYGVLLHQAPIIWTNVCVLLLTLTILGAKLRHG
jgi:MtN3 and saliva related transmembrane protein